MNSKLLELITPDSVLSYANACIQVRQLLLDLEKENYKRIVIPSRGAYPFYNGALQSHHISTVGRERVAIYHKFQRLLLPYTADWGNDAIGDIDISSRQVRKFWTKILADFLFKDKSMFTTYYQELVGLIGERYTVNTGDLLPRENGKINDDNKKFIFIDTAISGRAICEIIDSFHECNLEEFQIILIVDKNGEDIRKEYRDKINMEIALGRLFEIKVDKIFTEDASPIMTNGFASVVFPSLMEHSFHEIPSFSNEGFIGAGMWFVDSASHLRDTNKNLNGARGIIAHSIFNGITQLQSHDSKYFEEQISNDVHRAIDWLSDFNVFDKESTKSLLYNRLRNRGIEMNENVDVSSSHVIRIDISEKEREEFIKKVKRNWNK